MLDSWMGRGHKSSDGPDKVGLGTVRRPVIGLALGGGAARGFAHIGIIKTLLAHGIVPNVVVGTSIGSVVGGAYAAGHIETLEQWARGLQPRSVLGYLDIRLNGSGLIRGAKLAAEIEAALGQVMIEDLTVKFASVATEVRTGHEIWLTQGRVVDAMRASYALPGIFAPVLIGDRWLVDGALVNPVPVSAARALGAEIVIAANLSSDVFAHSTTIYNHGPSAAPEVFRPSGATMKLRRAISHSIQRGCRATIASAACRASRSGRAVAIRNASMNCAPASSAAESTFGVTSSTLICPVCVPAGGNARQGGSHRPPSRATAQSRHRRRRASPRRRAQRPMRSRSANS